MEIWDLYTEKREMIGKTHIRGDELPDELYHLVVHVWIRNSRGEYSISRRSADRPKFPLFYECVGGSAITGETSLDAAIREAKEEIGVDLDPSRGKVLWSKTRGVIDGRKFNDIMDVWLFEYDGELDLEKAETDEVCEVSWKNVQDIAQMNAEGKLVPTLAYFFNKVNN